MDRFYTDLRYENGNVKFDSLEKLVFVRSDSVVLLGTVVGQLSTLSVKASVCKILPNGKISAPIYSRTVGSGITINVLNSSERKITIVLIGNGENAADDPGQKYVADVEFTYDQDFTVGTTVGTATPMRRTLKGEFSIEEDYTVI
jgi:hypothetical protein